jgi:carboxymethylenebutenolidase
MAIRTSKIEIAAPDGVMPAHLSEPEGPGPHPAVVVLMEAFGLVPHIESVADRLAGEGYVAVAPDIYYRELPNNKVGYDHLDDAIGLMQKLDDQRFVEDMRATLDDLAARANVDESKQGVTGFCMGGRLAFLSACEFPDRIAAAAPFYGGGIVGHLAQAERIRAPLYLFFGEKDAFIPREQVDQVDAGLRELGVNYKLKSYAGADHGFFCDQRESYEPKAAEDAWSQLRSFFAEHLHS